MNSRLTLCSALALSFVVSAACSSDNKPPSATGGTGNTTGGTGVGTGGTTGGSSVSGTGGTTGGTTPISTGGQIGSSGGITGASGGAGGKAGSTGGASGTTGGSGGMTSTGGAAVATGGGPGSGGAKGSGGATGTGGKSSGGSGGATGGAGGGASGAATGGTGGAVSAGKGPCDIYAAASPATPCSAAYSTTRSLLSTYTGPLYQVRKAGNRLGTGGTTQDIGQVAGGFADSAAQDAFCGADTCTFSILYNQSGKQNNLKVAPAGCYEGTASEPDYESNAKQKSVQLGGHKVYALFMAAHEGYRNNTPTGTAKGSAAQGIYEVADGTHAGSACCWDFGIASTNNCNQGTMTALFFGTGFWGSGTGNGPWFMADFEGGVWAGGTGASTAENSMLPSSNIPFAFGILKSGPGNYAIRVGNAQSGALTTGYDGALPKTLSTPGGIILGIGGDNSNSSFGTFFEGAMTVGRPSDATDAAVLANVQAAGYGK